MYACGIHGAILVALLSVTSTTGQPSSDLDEARKFLEEYNKKSEVYQYESAIKDWIYSTNITDYNQEQSTEYSTRLAIFQAEVAKNCSRFNWKEISNQTIKRQFFYLCQLGKGALAPEEINELDRLTSEMEEIYSTAKVCLDDKCMDLEPELYRIFAKEKNWNKLEKVWEGWRNVSGRKIKEKYERFVELSNKVAKLDGFKDEGMAWRSNYEADDFVEQVEKLWKTVKPLYQQLHAFVRKRLRQVYKDNKFPESGHIPAHLLGNMWAQTWINIYDVTKPFPKASAINVTETLIKKKFNATDIVKLADDFFVSLGLLPMPDSFWRDSLFEKPTDGRQVVCHASAWDFYNRKDFRLLQCTDITQQYMEITHHEMGHLQYFLQYKHLPIIFRDGANNGFHEAVGDIAYLSVATPEYLNKIGLLDNLPEGNEADLNFLMYIALDRIAFLPFGYLIDQWRWSVFQGDTKPDKYNADWWDLRCNHQGLSPPVARSMDDFDPGAKYHVPANVPYIRYFVAFILQFQFHKALCEISNNTKPLHRCNIYQSKVAGEALGNMLKLGYSVPWPQALKQITGTEKMDATALLDYFKPLHDWLKKENKDEIIGWDDSCPPGSFTNSYSDSSAAVKSPICTNPLFILLFVIIANFLAKKIG